MISLFSFLTGLASVIIAFILYLVYIFVVRPYFLLQFYKIQGASTYLCPVAGTNPRDIENISKHGDFYYAAKEWARERPKARAQASTLGTSVLILLKDPELIKNFYLNHDQCYEKHPQFVRLIKMLAGNGVLLADGAIWKRHRKLASIAFSFEFLKEMIPEVVEVADECLESWKKKDLNNIDMLAEIQLITGELVGRLFFGETFSQYEIDGMNITQRLAEIVAEVSMENEFPRTFLLSEKLIKMGILDVHRKIVKKIMDFRAFIKSIAVQRLAEIEKEEKEGSGSTSTTKRKRVNLMELFYKQRKQNAAEAFSDEELVDGFITFFIAGTDTTGHLLTMASYYLMKNPQCKEKVYQDIDKYFSDPSTVSIDSLNKMDNLTALMKETLRISPVGGVMFYRVATQDNDLGGFKIKKGTILNISFLSNYWDSDYYEESEKFKPERWLEEGRTKKSVAENGYVYTPFSAGSRNCIGQHLAMNEARIIFSLFLKKFDYSLVDENYELKMTERSLYEPLDPLIYKIQLK